MHMAGAYARLTGRLGVAMASNGPGVANVLPGVAVEGEATASCSSPLRGACPSRTPTGAARISTSTRSA